MKTSTIATTSPTARTAALLASATLALSGLALVLAPTQAQALPYKPISASASATAVGHRNPICKQWPYLSHLCQQRPTR